MRALPVFALLGLSLVFTVGGVAIVGRADAPDQTPVASQSSRSQEPNRSVQPRAADPSPQFAERQCGAPRHFPSSYKGPMELRPGSAKKTDFVPVNTRGYNYALPGEVQFDPMGHARRDEAAKDAGASSPVPAAPAH